MAQLPTQRHLFQFVRFWFFWQIWSELFAGVRAIYSVTFKSVFCAWYFYPDVIVLEGQLTILRASYQQNLVVFFGHVFLGDLFTGYPPYTSLALSLSLSTWLLAAFCATKRPAEKNIHHIYAYLALIIWTDSPHYGHHVTSLWSGHCIHCHAYTSIRHPFTFTGAIVRIHDI